MKNNKLILSLLPFTFLILIIYLNANRININLEFLSIIIIIPTLVGFLSYYFSKKLERKKESLLILHFSEQKSLVSTFSNDLKAHSPDLTIDIFKLPEQCDLDFLVNKNKSLGSSETIVIIPYDENLARDECISKIDNEGMIPLLISENEEQITRVLSHGWRINKYKPKLTEDDYLLLLSKILKQMQDKP